MQQVLRHKLGLTLFVVIVMISNFVYAAEMVRWQDLTFAISPQDDPFYGLNYDARLDLETLLELDRKEKDGNAIDSDLVVKAKAAPKEST